MAKTIMVSEEAYELLVKFKLPGESFSEAIKRALKGSKSIASIAGSKTVSKEEWAKAEEAFKDQAVLDELRKKVLIELLKPT